MPDETIRFGLIGYGYAGATFHAPLIAAVPQALLVGVASRKKADIAQRFPDAVVYADPQSLLRDAAIDVVVVATPNDTHFSLAEAALRAGKHVVIDKPFAIDLKQARALVSLADETGKLLTVFHNRRWDSDFRSISDAIRDGLVGDPMHLEMHFDRFRPQVRERWREGAGPGAGIWFDLGPHLVDQALWLMGLPDRVTASMATQRSGGQSADWAHVILEFGPARAVLHASMLVAGGVPRFIVHGTQRSLVKQGMDPQESQLLAGMAPGATGWGVDTDPLVFHDGDGNSTTVASATGDQREFYRLVAEAVRGRVENPVPPIQSLAVMAILEAALQSAATGRSVAPPLTQDERMRWTESRQESAVK